MKALPLLLCTDIIKLQVVVVQCSFLLLCTDSICLTHVQEEVSEGFMTLKPPLSCRTLTCL